MNLENGPSKEAPKVKLTREQFDKIRTTPVADMKDLEVRAFQAEIGPLGLGVGAGTVKVEVDGEIFHMNTHLDYFGEIESAGQEGTPYVLGQKD